MSKKRISVIHGPNLNLLGSREPEHYGKMTLDDINASLKNRAKELNIDIEFFQSNSESEIVNKIQSLSTDFTIINPAAFTHSSVAIRDSLVAKNVTFIEVHLSNGFAREDFSKRDDKNFMKHTLAWQNDKKVEIKYRDVHSRTLTNDVQYFPPKERVY